MTYFWRTTLCALACLGAVAGCVSGQTYDASGNPQYPQYVQYPQSMPPVTPGVPAGQVVLSADQLDQLLGPIALYPDPLLSLIFPAATYPQDVAAAQQWLQSTPQPTEDAINAQPWDDSIKGLVHYPTVLKMMNDQMDWTNTVGAAFLNQQQDVMDSIQRLRIAAQVAQNLQSNQQEQVVTDADAIRIEPVNPDVLYVPQYDPLLVYTSPCPVSFGVGFPIGLWCDNDFDWDRRDVIIGGGWFDGWHSHPGDWDRRWPQFTRGRDGKPLDVHPWTRAPLRPAPRLTPAIVTRTGLDKPRVSPARRPEVVSKLPARIAAPPAHAPAPAGRIGSVPASPSSRNAFQPQDRSQVHVPQRTPTPAPAHVTPARPVTPVAPAPRVVTPPPPRVVTPPAPRTVAPPAPRTVAPPAVHVNPQPAPRVSAPQNVFGGASGGPSRVESDRGRASTHR